MRPYGSDKDMFRLYYVCSRQFMGEFNKYYVLFSNRAHPLEVVKNIWGTYRWSYYVDFVDLRSENGKNIKQSI